MKRSFITLMTLVATGAVFAAEGLKPETKPPVGPVQVTVTCDKLHYSHGEPGVNYIMAPTGRLKATLTATNSSNQAQTLAFRSGQKFDFIIRNADGKEVKRWSTSKMFTQALAEESLAAGRGMSFSENLSLGEAGKPLPEGGYVLEAILVCQPPLSARVPFKIVPTPLRVR